MGQPSATRPSRLVVVHYIEIAPPLRQQLPEPERVGEGLGKRGRAHVGELEDVVAALELAQVRDPEGIGLAVEVQRRHGGEADAGLQDRIGRPAEDLHRVSQVDQLGGQIPGVYALTAAVRVAPVGEIGHPERVSPPGSHDGTAFPEIDQSVK
jgi:hypothetical protein